jgi:hypothetical protein
MIIVGWATAILCLCAFVILVAYYMKKRGIKIVRRNEQPIKTSTKWIIASVSVILLIIAGLIIFLMFIPVII